MPRLGEPPLDVRAAAVEFRTIIVLLQTPNVSLIVGSCTNRQVAARSCRRHESHLNNRAFAWHAHWHNTAWKQVAAWLWKLQRPMTSVTCCHHLARQCCPLHKRCRCLRSQGSGKAVVGTWHRPVWYAVVTHCTDDTKAHVNSLAHYEYDRQGPDVSGIRSTVRATQEQNVAVECCEQRLQLQAQTTTTSVKAAHDSA